VKIHQRGQGKLGHRYMITASGESEMHEEAFAVRLQISIDDRKYTSQKFIK
jgi:hypothetical protein